MTTAPIAQTIHPGGSIPAPDRQDVLGPWLRANGINPRSVAAVEPITVLPVPHEADGGNWMIQVIVFSQFHELPDGTHDQNLITRQPVKFQRTVPLRVPFPTEPTDEEADGEEPQVGPVEEGQRPPQHQGGTQADEQQAVRPATAEEVPDRRPGARPQRTRQGRSARVPVAEEGRTQGRDAQVPQPETEEVAR